MWKLKIRTKVTEIGSWKITGNGAGGDGGDADSNVGVWL